MVLEAGYPNTSGFRKVTKATILIKKKEGMSDADFIAHYNARHAQMAAPVLLRHGIISYTLVRCADPLSTSSPFSRLLPRRPTISSVTGP